MKFVICFDSFKETMSATKAVSAVYNGWRSIFPNAQYECLPLSDGGEGLIEALRQTLGGSIQRIQVQGPRSAPVTARYLWIASSKTAVVESAQAIGLELLQRAERNPMLCSSYGLGQLLMAAHKKGAKKIIIGLGGSATVDGGIGMMQALGISLKDAQGNKIGRGGRYLSKIRHISFANAYIFASCDLEIASDVQNPLLGSKGAALFFGKQKGASPRMQLELESGMRNFITCLKHSIIHSSLRQHLPAKNLSAQPGFGAAGGLGAGLAICCNASLRSGIGLVLDTISFAQRIKKASLVLSGEGKIDAQSFHGKVPWGVLQECTKQNLPLSLIAGTVGRGYTALYTQGVDSIFTIHKELMDPIQQWDTIKKISYNNLVETARNIAFIYKRGREVRRKS